MLAEQFEQNRSHLTAVAYRMLGSTDEASDAVQEAWLRLNRTDASSIENLGGWLTTVVARVCLDMLRSRKARREEPLDTHIPTPVITREDDVDPEAEVLLADSVGVALLIVLETLTPAERLAFVLHDMFAVPFEEIADIVGRSPAAARQLASRARRRVQNASAPDSSIASRRKVVDAFFAAVRDGDFDALVAVLDPDVVLRSDGGRRRSRDSMIVRGAEAVAGGAVTFQRMAPFVRPALVNGTPGAVVVPRGKPYSVMAFTVARGRIVALDILVDPERLARLDLTAVADE